MHEIPNSNDVFNILLIIDCKLQSQYTPIDPTTVYLSNNRTLNAKENLKNAFYLATLYIFGHIVILDLQFIQLNPCIG